MALNNFYLILTPMIYVAWPVILTLALVAPYGSLRNFALATFKSTTTDGQQVWMGILGSCSQFNYSSPITCTKFARNLAYNLSSVIMPSDHGNITMDFGIPFQVARPSRAESGLVIFSLSISVTLWVLLIARAAHDWNRSAKSRFMMSIMRWFIGIFVIGSAIGPCIFMVFLVKFIQAVKTFNMEAERVGNTKFTAKPGTVYTVVEVGYTILFVVSLSLLYLESKAGPKSSKPKHDETDDSDSDSTK